LKGATFRFRSHRSDAGLRYKGLDTSHLPTPRTHEQLASFRQSTAGSDRNFGLAFSGLLAILGLWPLLHAASPKWPFLALSVAFAAAAILRPRWLAPCNRAWFKFGLALNKVAAPIVMGILFFGAVTPLAWYLRRRGKDLLRKSLEPDAATYWLERQGAGPVVDSFKKQF